MTRTRDIKMLLCLSALSRKNLITYITTMDAHKSGIFVFQFVKPILRSIKHLIQYTALEIEFCCVKCCLTAVTVGYAKISRIFIPSHQAMQAILMGGLYENKPFQNAFKRIQHYIYLFKLYGILIILLLENNSTNICRKISTIGMNL